MATAVFEVSDLDVAFPGADIVKRVPKYDAIGDEFKRHSNPGQKFAADAFYNGIKSLNATPREGVDTKKAMRALKAVLGCFSFSHEHKMAAAAWLMNEWFEPGFTWEKSERKP